jgi:hypothetical protein
MDVWMFRTEVDGPWEAGGRLPDLDDRLTVDAVRVALPAGLPAEYALRLLERVPCMVRLATGLDDDAPASLVRRVAERVLAVSAVPFSAHEAERLSRLLRLRWVGHYAGADSTEGDLRALSLTLADRLDEWAAEGYQRDAGALRPLALTLTDALWLRWSLDPGDLEDEVCMLPDESREPYFRGLHAELQRVVARLEDALEALGTARDGRCPDIEDLLRDDRPATPISVMC